MEKAIVSIKNLDKSFGTQPVLKDFSLDIFEGEFLSIVGPSGCGKSTLLNIIGLLDTMDSGEIYYRDKKIPKPFSREALRLLRNDIGYLFQSFALIEDKSVRYNLEVALESVPKAKRKMLIDEVLEVVGLSGFDEKLIFQCSGGEQQRVAIARLMLKPCSLVLCDEPSGSLDAGNKDIIINLLKQLQAQGKTIVVVTHDRDLVEVSDRIHELEIIY